jgi:hypothetical protein
VSNGDSTAAPLYVQVQVYNPLTNTGVAGVPVTIVIKDGASTVTRTVTTGADGTATICGMSGYTVSDNLTVGYNSISFGGSSLPADPSVPISVLPGVPFFC